VKFNQTKFRKQEFIDRVESVDVPALRRWFDFDEDEEQDDNAPCSWQVRGLSGPEFASMMDVASKSRNLNTIIEAISNSKVKTEELKKVLGMGSDTPEDLAKRIEQLVLGSVDPVVDSSLAIKLASSFPIEFYIITNKITALTGMGRDIKK